LFHAVNSGKYDYEIFGPNGFYRNFKGENQTELNISLNNITSKNEVELIFKNNNRSDETLILEDLYEKNQKKISLHQTEEKITLNLNKTKGWYDLKITSANHIWHFAGRIETGKTSISDPHWA
jgi:phospholipase C